MNIYYVYSHTNLKNDEIFYIGEGKITRMKSYSKGSSGRHKEYRKLHNLKPKDIKITILFECNDKKEALIKEEFYIRKYSSSIVNCGTRKDIASRAGKISGDLAVKNKLGIHSWTKEQFSFHNLRKAHSSANIEHCRKIAMATIETRRKKIRCITDDILFNSITEAAKYYKCTIGSIINVCKKRTSSFRNKEFEYYEQA